MKVITVTAMMLTLLCSACRTTVQTVRNSTTRPMETVSSTGEEDLKEILFELNRIISDEKYEKWLPHLSEKYIHTYGTHTFFNAINQHPMLKENGIRIKSLKDYFHWIVVPSRSQAEMDEIVFIEENQAIAYATLEKKRTRLYKFEIIDNVWKITVW